MKNINLTYPKLFLYLSIAILLILPSLSPNYAVSGDERFHTKWGEICYNFYKTAGEDTTALSFDFGDGGKVIYYGPSVDLFSEVIMDVFNIDRTQYLYEVKHFINSLFLVSMIVIASLLAVFLSGWRAGVISLLLFVSYPRIIGDGMVNPKDAIFASLYIICLYFIFKIISNITNPKWKHIVGALISFGLAMGNRVGGILLLIYFFMFLVGYLFFNQDKIPEVKNNFKNIGFKIAVFVVGGYMLGVLFWPYALMSPISHVLEALNYFTNQPYRLLTLFEGDKIYSTELPWYYTFKWILISATEICIIGFLLFAIFFKKNLKNSFFIYCLLFAFLFPILYIIYKKSGLYTGIRHIAFTIPPFVVLSSLGIDYLLQKVKKDHYRKIAMMLVLIGVLVPSVFIYKNFTNELCYFNNFSGGIEEAQGNYDTDYFGLTLKGAAEWLLENGMLNDSNVKVAVNYSPLACNYEIQKKYENISFGYFRYNERDKLFYDYEIVNTTLISPKLIQNGYFPPKGTIKTIDVDGVPLTAIVKRENRDDYYGKRALDSNNFKGAISHLTKAIQYDQGNELAWTNLGLAQLQTGQYDQSIQSLSQALAISPESIQAKNFLGYAYLNSGNASNAEYMFLQLIEQNPGFPEPYRMLSQINQQKGNTQAAQQYMTYYQQLKGQGR